MSPTLCPARPTRCRPLATEGGDSTWITRSTAPMSMPSSRLEVATTAGSLPGLQRLLDVGALLPGHRPVVRPRDRELRAIVTVERRPVVGELVEPAAQPLGQPARVREHDRGLVLLDQVKHPLLDVRPDRPARHRVVAGRLAVRASGLCAVSRSLMSSTGTTTSSSIRFALAAAPPSPGRAPPRNAATTSGGRTVADSPIRCAAASSCRAARPAVPATAPGARRACCPRPRAPRRR